MEQRSQSKLVDQKHLAEIARLEEANKDLDRQRRKLDEERKRCQSQANEAEARSAERTKTLDKTRRYCSFCKRSALLAGAAIDGMVDLNSDCQHTQTLGSTILDVVVAVNTEQKVIKARV